MTAILALGAPLPTSTNRHPLLQRSSGQKGVVKRALTTDQPASEQDSDASILADAAAQQAAEFETLRAIAAEAARIFGIEDRAALAIRMMDAPEIDLVD